MSTKKPAPARSTPPKSTKAQRLEQAEAARAAAELADTKPHSIVADLPPAEPEVRQAPEPSVPPPAVIVPPPPPPTREELLQANVDRLKARVVALEAELILTLATGINYTRMTNVLKGQ